MWVNELKEWNITTTITITAIILTTAENKSNRAESILKCMNGQSKASKRNRNTQSSINSHTAWLLLLYLDIHMQRWELNSEWASVIICKMWREISFFLLFSLSFFLLFNTLFLFDTSSVLVAYGCVCLRVYYFYV